MDARLVEAIAIFDMMLHLSQEQAAKANMFSVVRIQVFSIMHS